MDPLILFALLVLGIVALPGMDMAFVLGSSLASGRRAGFAAVAGLVSGGMVHVAMGTFGIGLVLQLVPAAFNAVLFAGAAYVAWVAWGLWRSPATLTAFGDARPREAGRTFAQALATCLLNPKAYMFMVAVFPQFLRADGGPLAVQATVLGTIIAVTQLLVYGAVAIGAAAFRSALVRSPRAQVMMARGVALVLAATAVWTFARAWRGG